METDGATYECLTIHEVRHSYYYLMATKSVTLWRPDGNPACSLMCYRQPWVIYANLEYLCNPECNNMNTWWQPWVALQLWVQRYEYLMATLSATIWLPDGNPEFNDMIAWWQPWGQRCYYLMATLNSTIWLPDGNPEYNGIITWWQPWVQQYYFLMATLNSSTIWLPDGNPECLLQAGWRLRPVAVNLFPHRTPQRIQHRFLDRWN